MIYIGISQRVDIIDSYDERRDSLDQKWIEFLKNCSCLPVLIPNNKELAKTLLDKFTLNGILLTGGNNLVEYNGFAPERDETEYFLIDYAVEKNVPVIGICRGMQVIQNFFDIKLKKIKGHVNTKHKINFENSTRLVNSYHNFGTTTNNNEIITLAKSEDKIIEAIRHKNYDIHGIMWHPERVYPFDADDIEFFQKIYFKGGTLYESYNSSCR